MRPILSIVIPTKDRYNTLYNIVSYLMTWSCENYEVVVQDNSTNNALGAELCNSYLSDSRFKYHYNSCYLSAIENCQLAIENSTGEYICFLGDDDGVISQVVNVAMWMKREKIDSMTCKHGNYFWPEYRVKNFSKSKSLAGTLTYRNHSGIVENLNPMKELETVLLSGALIMNKITRVYHGIVSKHALDLVLNKTGSYFPGPVPDMTSSVALSFFVNSHVFIDYPLIIAGASKNSMAGRGSQKKAHGSIANEKSLPANTIDVWSEQLPKYWAPNTIWPEGALQALRRTGNEYLIEDKMNFMKVYAALYIDTKSYRKDLITFIREKLSLKDFGNFKRYVRKEYLGLFKNKLKQTIKVYAIMLKVGSYLGFTTIYSNDICSALLKLEEKTNLFSKAKVNELAQILNHEEKC